MSKIKSVTVCCEHCGGSGVREVTGIYLETLLLLRKQRAAIHGAALARIAGVAGPAMNNRLAKLEELGLATSQKWGRERLYTALSPDRMASGTIRVRRSGPSSTGEAS